MDQFSNHILRLARAYTEHTGVPLSTIGLQAANHWGFFAKLEEGQSLTTRRYRRITAWFAEHWPADIAWPRMDDGGIPISSNEVLVNNPTNGSSRDGAVCDLDHITPAISREDAA